MSILITKTKFLKIIKIKRYDELLRKFGKQSFKNQPYKQYIYFIIIIVNKSTKIKKIEYNIDYFLVY